MLLYGFLIILLLDFIECLFPTIHQTKNLLLNKLEKNSDIKEHAQITTLLLKLDSKSEITKSLKNRICNNIENYEKINSNEHAYNYLNTFQKLDCSHDKFDSNKINLNLKDNSLESQYYIEKIKSLTISKKLKSFDNSASKDHFYKKFLNVDLKTLKVEDLIFAMYADSDLDRKIDKNFLETARDHFFNVLKENKINLIDSIRFLSASIKNDKNGLKIPEILEILNFIEKNLDFKNLKAHVDLISVLNNNLIVPAISHDKYFELINNKNVFKFSIFDKINNFTFVPKIFVTGSCDSHALKSNEFSVRVGVPNFITIDKNVENCDFEIKLDDSYIFGPAKISVTAEKPLKIIDIVFSYKDQTDISKNLELIFSSQFSIISTINSINLEFLTTSKNTRVTPKQVFLIFDINLFSVIYPAKIINDRLIFSIDFAQDTKKFFGVSGTYSMKLIISNPGYENIVWDLGAIDLKFSGHNFYDRTYKLLPIELNTPKILFKRPVWIFPFMFSCVTVALFVFMLLLWGLNVKLSIKMNIWRFFFYTSFAGTFGVCFLYWRFLNGFEALNLYIPLVVIVCLSLNYVLDIKTKI